MMYSLFVIGPLIIYHNIFESLVHLSLYSFLLPSLFCVLPESKGSSNHLLRMRTAKMRIGVCAGRSLGFCFGSLFVFHSFFVLLSLFNVEKDFF